MLETLLITLLIVVVLVVLWTYLPLPTPIKSNPWIVFLLVLLLILFVLFQLGLFDGAGFGHGAHWGSSGHRWRWGNCD
jgi:uncharacterized membrane protein